MNSKALINETLKYLEKNKNGTPRYKFDIYKRGSTPEPVRIYTVGDLFDTLTGIKGGILENVSDLRSRLNNIKVSLEQLGFTSLNTTINMMITAIVPIETIQTIEKTYRIVRPLYEKIADIASIYFHFTYSSLIVQDVLQYLTRLAVQTARNYLQKLWNSFLTTPVFAIYENTGESVNLAEVYSLISTEANKMIDGITSDRNAFNTIVNFINTSTDQRMNWPKYGELGIVSPYTIKDIYHDPSTSNIIVASYDNTENKSYIYSLQEDYTLKEVYSAENKEIQRVYLYKDEDDNEIYYITNNNTINRIKADGSVEVKTISDANLDIIFSNPLLLYSNNKIYSATGDEIPDLNLPDTEKIVYHCYNSDENYIYAIIEDANNKYSIYAIGKNSSEQYVKEPLGTLDSTPYGISCFNGIIFIVLKDSNEKYYLIKIKSAMSFDRDDYVFSGMNTGDKTILWTNGNFSTNGSLIYENNGSALNLVSNAPEAINSIFKINYNNKDYLICSGGTSIYSSLFKRERLFGNTDSIVTDWNRKIINFTDSKNNFSPDNMAGCSWYKSDTYGDSFLAYSHKNIFFFGKDKVNQLFAGVGEPEGPKQLAYKVRASFKDYWKEEKKQADTGILHYSKKITAPTNCVITVIRSIGKDLYVAFYNPSYVNTVEDSMENLPSGVYKATVVYDTSNNTSYEWNGLNYSYGNYSLEIDYSNPVFTSDSRKIYSFDYISNHWYYIDSQTLYDATNNYGINLDLNNELDPNSKMSKYYELTGRFEKTTDTSIDTGKTYYYYDSSFDSYLKVDNPVIEDIGLYYELTGRFEKTGDASVNASKTYYTYNKRFDSFIKVKDPAGVKEYDGAIYIDKVKKEAVDTVIVYTSKALLTGVSDRKFYDIRSNVDYKCKNTPQIACTPKTVLFSDGEYIYNIIDTTGYKLDYDLFQICYIKGVFDYNIIQSNKAAFIVSDNVIKKVPINSFITSSNYGCGYYTDTTLNEWYGAAPYYFASNVLNENKNKVDRNVYIASFYENFKVELEKLLKNIPNAFVNYTKNKLKEKLTDLGIKVEDDDGQITSLIIDSVSSVSANSVGMYIQQRFYERIGDDTTYKIFADSVYEACKQDKTNDMTKDFYDIFEALYYSVIPDPVPIYDRDAMANYLLRYYQNHKDEWAESMMRLIDVDKVKEEDYEIPLNVNYSVSQNTYTFNYTINNYQFDYKNNIVRKKLKGDNVITGYAKKEEGGKITFYSDSDFTYEIDKRTRSENGDYYEDGSILCYFNPEDGNFYEYKIEDYVLSSDTEVYRGKTYYERVGDNTYVYKLTEDENEVDGKQYFELGKQPTEDTRPVDEKTYYKQVGGENVYYRPGDDYYNTDGSLKYKDDSGDIIVYYEEKTYSPTEDTSVDSSKTYYSQYYVQATGEVDENTQYYSLQYEKTTDITLTPNKVYFEKVDYSEYSGALYTPFFKMTEDEYVNPYKTYYTCNDLTGTYTIVTSPDDKEIRNYYETVTDEATTRYSRKFVEVDTLDRFNEYYTRSGSGTEQDPYVFTLVYEPDITDGPFYVVDSFEENENGEYYEVANTGEVVYSAVLNPSVDGLIDYYEINYGAIKTPDSLTDGIFKKEFIAVSNPNDVDITTYFEKNEVGYVVAEDVEYVYEDEEIHGIVNDRAFFLVNFKDVDYEEVTVGPDDNPYLLGYYEDGYSLVKPNTFENPKAEKYYERTLNAISFEEVENPSGSPVEQGWFEYIPAVFSTPYVDNRIYIDLDPITIEGNFDEEDDKWHEVFYNDVNTAKESLDFEKELNELKKDALVALNGIHYIIYPSWIWQELITKAVTEFYIPIQGEQYRTIVNESNMYPIQWNELPDDINQSAFDLALTTLLNEIKQRLNTNISILVDNGLVKCYSCVDASSVIKKMVEKNGSVWFNQLRAARRKVVAATTNDEVLDAFNMIKTFNPSRYMLKVILDAQSALYAKYIDQIIKEQIINDYETEVSTELYESYARGTGA